MSISEVGGAGIGQSFTYCSILDRDTIVIGNTVEFDIANNDIYGIDDVHAT